MSAYTLLRSSTEGNSNTRVLESTRSGTHCYAPNSECTPLAPFQSPSNDMADTSLATYPDVPSASSSEPSPQLDRPPPALLSLHPKWERSGSRYQGHFTDEAHSIAGPRSLHCHAVHPIWIVARHGAEELTRTTRCVSDIILPEGTRESVASTPSLPHRT
jgi:hypothetical protein